MLLFVAASAARAGIAPGRSRFAPLEEGFFIDFSATRGTVNTHGNMLRDVDGNLEAASAADAARCAAAQRERVAAAFAASRPWWYIESLKREAQEFVPADRLMPPAVAPAATTTVTYVQFDASPGRAVGVRHTCPVLHLANGARIGLAPLEWRGALSLDDDFEGDVPRVLACLVVGGPRGVALLLVLPRASPVRVSLIVGAGSGSDADLLITSSAAHPWRRCPPSYVSLYVKPEPLVTLGLSRRHASSAGEPGGLRALAGASQHDVGAASSPLLHRPAAAFVAADAHPLARFSSYRSTEGAAGAGPPALSAGGPRREHDESSAARAAPTSCCPGSDAEGAQGDAAASSAARELERMALVDASSAYAAARASGASRADAYTHAYAGVDPMLDSMLDSDAALDALAALAALGDDELSGELDELDSIAGC